MKGFLIVTVAVAAFYFVHVGNTLGKAGPTPTETGGQVAEEQSERDQATTTLRQQLEIAAQCQSIVRKRLKAPSTAEFEYGPYAEGHHQDTGEPIGIYIGYVDSENSFGAKLRNEFTCLYYVDDNRIELVSLE